MFSCSVTINTVCLPFTIEVREEECVKYGSCAAAPLGNLMFSLILPSYALVIYLPSIWLWCTVYVTTLLIGETSLRSENLVSLHACWSVASVYTPLSLSLQHTCRANQSQLSVFNQALDTDSLPWELQPRTWHESGFLIFCTLCPLNRSCLIHQGSNTLQYSLSEEE